MKHLALYLGILGGLLGMARAAQPDSAPSHGSGHSPNHPVTVRGLDLSRAPATEELMSAGQLGGPLFPMHELADKKREEAARWDFGRAIEEWNKHNYRNAVEMFRKHARDYPDSPWAGEAILHVGCDATYNGRYTEAETIFRQLIAANQGKEHTGAKMLLGKARQRLGLLKVEQNNLDEAQEHFRALLDESPDWRHRTYASHWIQRISRYKGAGQALLTCGAEALAYALERDGHRTEAGQVRTNLPTTMRGHSMANLSALAAEHGYEMAALQVEPADLQRLPLPAVLHILPRNAGDKGHYWVLDRVRGGEVELFDPQSKHRFSQTMDELAHEWTGKALALAKPGQLPGRRLDPQEMDDAAGGCCGAPRSQSNMGNGGQNDVGSGGGSGKTPNGKAPNSCGAPTWEVNIINLNLFITDTPMWYDPPYGPPVRITVCYNSQSAITSYEPFGNKWQFNYGSYLVVDTAGSVLLFMPDGRQDSYAPDGLSGYRKPFGVFNTLTRLGENYFELRFPDDTVYVYRIPPGTSSQQPFLTEIRDAYGNKLSFGYDAAIHLTTITDVQAKVWTLSYSASGLCTNVADPFGRNSRFEYDASRNLSKITDMGGYWSSLSYDTNVYLTSLGDDRGTWGFWIEPADGRPVNGDNYPPPGDGMFQNYRITVTNPLGQREEFMYYGGCDEFGCAGHSWHVSFRDYVPWESQTVNNFLSRPPKTVYLPTVAGSGRDGRISRVIYPGGGFVQYEYDSATGQRASVTDNHGHTWRYTYNELGRLTSATDPAGTPTACIYASNQVDLLSVSNGLGQIRFAYNAQHNVTAITDRLTNTTTLAYKANGQLSSTVDPLSTTNEYLYGADQRLTEFRRAGQTLGRVSFDATGRPRTSTDATGLTITNDWNDLNQLTRVTYPDGRLETYAYSTCCPRLLDSITDRGGRTTFYIYDALKRMMQTVNPEGGITQIGYDANSNPSTLTDPNGNVTSFAYDLDNRLVRKFYADGKGPGFTYDLDGLLLERTNARGTVTAYSYDANHNLLYVTHSDGTPGFTNTYDAFGRLVGVLDGIGTSSYVYDSNSRLVNHDGPWANDLITYAYDPVGHRTNLTVEGSAPIKYAYDPLERLTSVTSDTSTFTYSYINAFPLIKRITRLGAASHYTDYEYDNLNRLTHISNRAGPSAAPVTDFSYTYNADDLRDSETILSGPSNMYTNNEQTLQTYNELNELVDSSSLPQPISYDSDGNMTRCYTPLGEPFSAAYDAENRITAAAFTNAAGNEVRMEYRYNYAGLVAEERCFEDGALVMTSRKVRDGVLVLQERDLTNTISRTFTWGAHAGGGIGGLLAVRQNGSSYTYAYDGRGNVTALIDTDGNLVATYLYDAFGRLVSKAGNVTQPYQFSTKPVTERLGTYDFGYRFYTPIVGRWLSRDSVGEFDVPNNLYTFVKNSPTSYLDRYGNNPVAVVIIGIAIAYNVIVVGVQTYNYYHDQPTGPTSIQNPSGEGSPRTDPKRIPEPEPYRPGQGGTPSQPEAPPPSIPPPGLSDPPPVVPPPGPILLPPLLPPLPLMMNPCLFDPNLPSCSCKRPVY
jgi:RHS repeat-associated protein